MATHRTFSCSKSWADVIGRLVVPDGVRSGVPGGQGFQLCDIPADEAGEVSFPGTAQWMRAAAGVKVTADQLLDFLILMFASPIAEYYGVVESARIKFAARAPTGGLGSVVPSLTSADGPTAVSINWPSRQNWRNGPGVKFNWRRSFSPIPRPIRPILLLGDALPIPHCRNPLAAHSCGAARVLGVAIVHHVADANRVVVKVAKEE